MPRIPHLDKQEFARCLNTRLKKRRERFFYLASKSSRGLSAYFLDPSYKAAFEFRTTPLIYACRNDACVRT